MGSLLENIKGGQKMACKNCPENKKYIKPDKTELDILLQQFEEQKINNKQLKQKIKNYIQETIIVLCPKYKNCYFIDYLNKNKF